MPISAEYVGVGVPVIPATSKVIVIEEDVGVPLTTGTEGGPEGATPEPFDVVTPALTALTLEPFSFVATDLK